MSHLHSYIVVSKLCHRSLVPVNSFQHTVTAFLRVNGGPRRRKPAHFSEATESKNASSLLLLLIHSPAISTNFFKKIKTQQARGRPRKTIKFSQKFRAAGDSQRT